VFTALSELDGGQYEEFEWTKERGEDILGDVLIVDIRLVLGPVFEHMADDVVDVVLLYLIFF